MLRRHPTQITLTPEDIAAYDDSRLQRLARLQQQENVDPSHSRKNMDGQSDPSDELKPLPGGKNPTGRSNTDVARERQQRIMGR